MFKIFPPEAKMSQNIPTLLKCPKVFKPKAKNMLGLGIEFCGVESDNLGLKNKPWFQGPNIPRPPCLTLSNHHV